MVSLVVETAQLLCHLCFPQDFIQQLQPGQGVIFCREPSNAADPHAVAVHTAGMQQLGYIPREAAQRWKLEVQLGPS